ncbi:MAG TPA: metal-dependent hydrolase [Thauera sp.]|nr:metal-dependent hydrolase [Thauera sp.]
MDPFTHLLSGALVARATAPARPSASALPLRLRLFAGGAAAVFPDIDLALRLVDTLTYLNWHQGPTHAPLLLPAWAALLAWLCARASGGRHRWTAFYGPACLGIAIHIVGDLITAYGLMLYAPLSTERVALNLAFVIDPWISAILLAGLVLSLRHSRGGRTAVLALLLCAAYLGLLLGQQQRALAIGEAFASARGMQAPAVHALPQPLSPAHWMLVVEDAGQLHVAHVRVGADAAEVLSAAAAAEPAEAGPLAAVLGPLVRLRHAYRPAPQADWQTRGVAGTDRDQADFARAAWAQPVAADLRRFARFPVLDAVEPGPPACAWFVDLRFALPTLPPSFRYAVCRDEWGGEGRGGGDGREGDGDARWTLQRARGAFWID